MSQIQDMEFSNNKLSRPVVHEVGVDLLLCLIYQASAYMVCLHVAGQAGCWLVMNAYFVGSQYGSGGLGY